MFVVVFIKAAKKKIVIPEEWIYDVNQELLKNKGVNSNREVLVFWSKSAIDANGWPNSMHTPNFLAAKSVDFPPENDEACYHVRVIHYFESFELASAHCEKFRPKLPPHYNNRRQFDKPIPSLNPVSPAIAAFGDNLQQDSDEETESHSPIDHNGDDSLVEEQQQPNGSANNVNSDSSEGNEANTTEQFQNNESVVSEGGIDENRSANDNMNSTHVEEANTTDEPFQGNDSVLSEDGFDEIFSANHVEHPIQDYGENLASEELQSNENESASVGDTGSEDVKNSLQTVQMDLNDKLAINSLFDNSANDGPSEMDEILPQIELTLGDGETAEKKGDKIVITKIIDDELEMVYTYGETPKVLPPLYQVKMNDAISENIPFKENPEGDRAYYVKIDGQFEELKIAALLVKGLLQLNKDENRGNANLDKPFIKALIIGLCTIKKVESGEPVNKDLMIFIKELFGIRIFGKDDGEGSRHLSFGALVDDAYKEIRSKNYKS